MINSTETTLRLQAEKEELISLLEGAVKSLAEARDFISNLITDKHEKWNIYVELTTTMKIPEINVFLNKMKL